MRMSDLIMAYLWASGGFPHEMSAQHPAPTDDELLAEYELIKQKKSKLSANQRRRVVAIVERMDSSGGEVND